MNQNLDSISTDGQIQISSNNSSPRAARNEKHNVHFVLQAKGGVGKTLIASLLAQYLGAKGQDVECFDTDPQNASLEEFKDLTVKGVDLYKHGTSEVDFRQLDRMIEHMALNPKTYVVDNGAASFVPVSTYLLESAILDLLIEHGASITFHPVIATGPELSMTMTGTQALIEALPLNSPIRIILWINEQHGPIVEYSDGFSFEETAFYLKNKAKFDGFVSLNHMSVVRADNFKAMLSRKLTFEAVKLSDTFFPVKKSRLGAIQKELFDAMSRAGV